MGICCRSAVSVFTSSSLVALVNGEVGLLIIRGSGSSCIRDVNHTSPAVSQSPTTCPSPWRERMTCLCCLTINLLNVFLSGNRCHVIIGKYETEGEHRMWKDNVGLMTGTGRNEHSVWFLIHPVFVFREESCGCYCVTQTNTVECKRAWRTCFIQYVAFTLLHVCVQHMGAYAERAGEHGNDKWETKKETREGLKGAKVSERMLEDEEKET